ncbi:MAG: PAS domain S-box protein [Candidatus Omnitrophota bacterium]
MLYHTVKSSIFCKTVSFLTAGIFLFSSISIEKVYAGDFVSQGTLSPESVFSRLENHEIKDIVMLEFGLLSLLKEGARGGGKADLIELAKKGENKRFDLSGGWKGSAEKPMAFLFGDDESYLNEEAGICIMPCLRGKEKYWCVAKKEKQTRFGEEVDYTYTFFTESEMGKESLSEKIYRIKVRNRTSEIQALLKKRPDEDSSAVDKALVSELTQDKVIREAMRDGNYFSLTPRDEKRYPVSFSLIYSFLDLVAPGLYGDFSDMVAKERLIVICDERFTAPHPGGQGIYLPYRKDGFPPELIVHEIFAKAGFPHEDNIVFESIFRKFRDALASGELMMPERLFSEMPVSLEERRLLRESKYAEFMNILSGRGMEKETEIIKNARDKAFADLIEYIRFRDYFSSMEKRKAEEFEDRPGAVSTGTDEMAVTAHLRDRKIMARFILTAAAVLLLDMFFISPVLTGLPIYTYFSTVTSYGITVRVIYTGSIALTGILYQREINGTREKEFILRNLEKFHDEIMKARGADDTITAAVKYINEGLKIQHVSIALIDEERHVFKVIAKRIKRARGEIHRGEDVKWDDTVLSTLTSIREPLYRDDLASNVKYQVDKKLVYEENIKSDYLIPLRIEDECIGFLNCASLRKDGIPLSIRRTLRHMAPSLAFAIRNSRVTEESERNERQYLSLIENIPDVLFSADSEFNPVYISSNIARVTGYTEKEVYSDKEALTKRCISGEDCARLRSGYDMFFEKGKPFDEEFRLTRKDGSEIWLHIRAVKKYEKDGKFYTDGILSDITWRKKAEEALFESSEQFRLLFRNAADLIYIVDVQGKIIEVNPAVEKLLSYRADELRGKDITGFFSGGSDGPPLKENAASEKEIVTKNGVRVPVEDSSVSVKNDKGEFLFTVVFQRDVRERKRLEKEIEKRKLLRGLGRFVQRAAHELKNPFAVIQGNLSRILFSGVQEAGSAGKKGEAQGIKEKAEEALGYVKECTAWVDRLLRFAMEDNRKKDTYRLKDICEKARVRAEPARGNGNIEINIPEDLMVSGNESALVGVFEQIIVNAYEAAKETKKNTVKIACGSNKDDPGNVIIVISDTGTGISPEMLEEIYSPLFTTRKKETGGARGLGLAIAEKTVCEYGGTMKIESQQGEWTKVIVSLPLAVKKTKIDPSMEKQRRIQPYIAGEIKHILVVDDYAAIRDTAKNFLENLTDDNGQSLDITVDTAGSPEEAIDMLKKSMSTGARCFDAVITDISMPEGLEGFVLAVKAREMGFRGPIGVCSAHVMADEDSVQGTHPESEALKGSDIINYIFTKSAFSDLNRAKAVVSALERGKVLPQPDPAKVAEYIKAVAGGKLDIFKSDRPELETLTSEETEYALQEAGYFSSAKNQYEVLRICGDTLTLFLQGLERDNALGWLKDCRNFLDLVIRKRVAAADDQMKDLQLKARQMKGLCDKIDETFFSLKAALTIEDVVIFVRKMVHVYGEERVSAVFEKTGKLLSRDEGMQKRIYRTLERLASGAGDKEMEEDFVGMMKLIARDEREKFLVSFREKTSPFMAGISRLMEKCSPEGLSIKVSYGEKTQAVSAAEKVIDDWPRREESLNDLSEVFHTIESFLALLKEYREMLEIARGYSVSTGEISLQGTIEEYLSHLDPAETLAVFNAQAIASCDRIRTEMRAFISCVEDKLVEWTAGGRREIRRGSGDTDSGQRGTEDDVIGLIRREAARAENNVLGGLLGHDMGNYLAPCSYIELMLFRGAGTLDIDVFDSLKMLQTIFLDLMVRINRGTNEKVNIGYKQALSLIKTLSHEAREIINSRLKTNKDWQGSRIQFSERLEQAIEQIYNVIMGIPDFDTKGASTRWDGAQADVINETGKMLEFFNSSTRFLPRHSVIVGNHEVASAGEEGSRKLFEIDPAIREYFPGNSLLIRGEAAVLRLALYNMLLTCCVSTGLKSEKEEAIEQDENLKRYQAVVELPENVKKTLDIAVKADPYTKEPVLVIRSNYFIFKEDALRDILGVDSPKPHPLAVAELILSSLPCKGRVSVRNIPPEKGTGCVIEARLFPRAEMSFTREEEKAREFFNSALAGVAGFFRGEEGDKCEFASRVFTDRTGISSEDIGKLSLEEVEKRLSALPGIKYDVWDMGNMRWVRVYDAPRDKAPDAAEGTEGDGREIPARSDSPDRTEIQLKTREKVILIYGDNLTAVGEAMSTLGRLGFKGTVLSARNEEELKAHLERGAGIDLIINTEMRDITAELRKIFNGFNKTVPETTEAERGKIESALVGMCA